MTTTPQPIQQQAFSFTPPGTFSQGFGFVPTRLRIDNPSSYYLTFPDVPSIGTITPYTFGAVVPWNQSGMAVVISTNTSPSGAPPIPSNNATITILASTDPSLMIQPGITLFQSITTIGLTVEVVAGTSEVTVELSPTLGATAVGVAIKPFTVTGSATEYTITLKDNFTGEEIYYQVYTIGNGAILYEVIPPAAVANGITLTVNIFGGTFSTSEVIGQTVFYLTSVINTPSNTTTSPLYVIGPASQGSLANGEDIVVYGVMAGSYNNGLGAAGVDVIEVGAQAAELSYTGKLQVDQIIASGALPPIWSSTTTYVVGNSVIYDGILYVAYVAPPTGTLPTNTSYWIQMTASYVIAG